MTHQEYKKNYRARRAWAEQFTPAVKNILGGYVLQSADDYTDYNEATDLITFRMAPMNIGMRMRHPEYAERYPWEFTMRCMNYYNTNTEFKKIEAGLCDWFFYGFASPFGHQVARWFLIDLNVLRQFLDDHHAFCYRSFPLINNGDGSTFRAFDVRCLPQAAIVASSTPVPREDLFP